MGKLTYIWCPTLALLKKLIFQCSSKINFASMTNQLPMLPAKNPSLIRGPGMAVMDISIVDLSHWVPLAPQGLLICTFYPNEIFGGKHGELIRQIKTNTWEHNNRTRKFWGKVFNYMISVVVEDAFEQIENIPYWRGLWTPMAQL